MIVAISSAMTPRTWLVARVFNGYRALVFAGGIEVSRAQFDVDEPEDEVPAFVAALDWARG